MGKSHGRKTVRFTDDFPLALRNSNVLIMYISEQDNDSIQQMFTKCPLSRHREGVWPGLGKELGTPWLGDWLAGPEADCRREAHPSPSANRPRQES